MLRRLVVLLAGVGVMSVAACSPSAPDSTSPPPTLVIIDEIDIDPVLTAPGGEPDEVLANTTTTEPPPPPRIVGWSGNIDLTLGQCWDEVPASTTTTTLPTTSSSEPETTTTTAAPATTVARSEPPPTTGTLPARPAAVAVVDCAGPNAGRTYAVVCLGLVAGELGAVGCDTEVATIDWPGGQVVQRIGAAACLAEFETVFGESYTTSRRDTVELIPNQGVWELGRRQVVCTATEPAPLPTSTTTITDG